MNEYSESELRRLKRAVMNKDSEIEKETRSINLNKTKIEQLKSLEAGEELYVNEAREIEYAEARIYRWKELLKADLEDAFKMLNGRYKEMARYLSKTPGAREIDASLKQKENEELEQKIKALEEKKQKKETTILNYEKIGDDDRVEELRADVQKFEKELKGLTGKKTENQKIIELNSVKREDALKILEEIRGVKGFAKKHGIELEIEEEKAKEAEEKTEKAKKEEPKVIKPEPAEVKPEESKVVKKESVKITPEEPKIVKSEPVEEKLTEPKLEPVPKEPKVVKQESTEVKPAEQNNEIQFVETIEISPEGIFITGINNDREKVQNQLSLSEDNAEEILLQYNFEEGTEAYNRVDPNIVKALVRNPRQLEAYLNLCKLDINESGYAYKLDQLADDLPRDIRYQLQGIRKANIDFEDKDFMYARAKDIVAAYSNSNYLRASMQIGILDRISLFVNRKMRQLFPRLYLQEGLEPKGKEKMIEGINENLQKEYDKKEASRYSSVRDTAKLSREDQEAIDEVKAMQASIAKAKSEYEAKKTQKGVDFVQSDGDINR